jgi:5-methylcytosine-specific restriction endonuclease McrA
VYCGLQFPKDELTLDHVQPRVRGGDRSEGNLVTACRGCNTLKGQKRLSLFLHENPSARENFVRLAVHVWQRQMRLLVEELAELDRRSRS